MPKTRRQKSEDIVDDIVSGSSDMDSLLKSITADIRKDFDLSDTRDNVNDFLSSGNLGLNFILSGRANGGFPVGLITEIFGENSTGKTLIALNALVETQRRDGIAILIDVERSFNHVWFTTLGGDPDRLILYQPDTMEEVFDFLQSKVVPLREKLTKAGAKDKYITVVWDSLAQTSTKSEMEADMMKAEMAMRARISSKGLRKVMGALNRAHVTWIVINQVRATMAMYGPDVDTVGGKAMKFASSVRLHCKKGKHIDQNKKKIGISGRVICVKSRLTAPFKEALLDIFYDGGINPISGFLEVLKEEGAVANPLNADGKESKGWWIFTDGSQTYDDKWRETDFLSQLKLRPEMLPKGFGLGGEEQRATVEYDVVDDEASSDIDDE